MATVNLGRIKPVFRGAYNNSTAYVVDDIVTQSDETFICIQASTGNATSNASYWTKLAAKGTDGTDVGTTITTQGDILYRDGSGLQRLAKGTANQQLRMNSGANAPEWFTAQGGAILQTKTAQYFGTTNAATSSTGVDISTLHSDFDHLKIDITPASATSKFLVQFGAAFAGNSSNYGCIFIQRGIASGTLTQLTGGSHMGNGSGDSHNLWSAQYFDAPNTTSVVNYRIYARRHSGGQIQINDIGSNNGFAGGIYLAVFEYDGSICTITNS